MAATTFFRFGGATKTIDACYRFDNTFVYKELCHYKRLEAALVDPRDGEDPQV